VFITDEAEILPRYLRFVRGLVDSADLPLNVSREMIQESPILTAIKKGVISHVLGDLEKLAQEPDNFNKIWDTFGAVIKEDPTASPGCWSAGWGRVRRWRR
jgi:molecular chaperone HtpG